MGFLDKMKETAEKSIKEGIEKGTDVGKEAFEKGKDTVSEGIDKTKDSAKKAADDI